MRNSILAMIVFTAVSCSNGATTQQASHSEDEKPASAVGEEPGPIALDGNCRVLADSTPLPSHDSHEVECLSQDSVELASAPPRFYDSCDAEPWIPDLCSPLPFGNRVCENGRWTVLCAQDADCPSGARCSWGLGVGTKPGDIQYGTCELTCGSIDGEYECVRCDMECDTENGICVTAHEASPPIECRGDCECPEGACVAGTCDPYAASSRRGICESIGGDCACIGGNCDERGCCVLPDGTIDDGSGEACHESE